MPTTLRCTAFLLVAVTVRATFATEPLDAAPAPPNIVFVLIDDLGWSDLACQGNPVVDTPHIDRLALQGTRFTDAYAAAPVCSPTRAALMTGLAPARLHITNHLPDRASFTPENAKVEPARMIDHLPLEHVTVAERLKTAGYATGFLGKWHLGGREFFPDEQGFDLNVGGCEFGGPPTFFDPYRIPTLPDRKPGEYLPDRLADEAVTFLREHRDERFALFLWNYTVHWPMEAPEPLLAKYADHRGPGLNDPRYGAMIEAMDRAFGRVLAELDQLGLVDSTLVVFTSDNGGFAGVSDNRPLRAAKGHLYEGGLRVPLIVRWPGAVSAGKVEAEPVVSMDLTATLLDAAKVDVAEPLDGESLLPLLTGTGRPHRDALFFHYPNYAWHKGNRLGSAIRAGRYKLIERFDDGSVELYDLEADLGEKRNLAELMSDRAAKMLARLHAWLKDVGANMPPGVAIE